MPQSQDQAHLPPNDGRTACISVGLWLMFQMFSVVFLRGTLSCLIFMPSWLSPDNEKSGQIAFRILLCF